MGRDEIERAIGPLEAVLAARGLFGWGPALLGGAVLLFALGGGLLDFGPAAPGRLGPAFFAIAVLLVALGVVVPQLRRDRLYLGAKGLAEEDDDGATVVLWADLGRDWHAVPVVAMVGFIRSMPLLILQRGDGRLFRLRPIYDGADAVAARIRDHLRKNGRHRPAGDPATFRLPPGGTAGGPWIDDAEAIGIGPVRFVAFPDPEGTRRFREQLDRDLGLWRVLGTTRPALLILFLLLLLFGWDNLRPVAAGALLLAVSASLAFADYRARALEPTGSVWVVGERGLVRWQAGQVVVVYWDDLGREWFEQAEVGPEERRKQRLPILLKLQNTRLDCCYVTELHEHAAGLVALIRTGLALRGSPFAEAEPAPRPVASRAIQEEASPTARSTRITTTPPTAPLPPDLEPGPWLDDERLDAIGPLELVCYAPVLTAWLLMPALASGLWLCLVVAFLECRVTWLGLPLELQILVAVGLAGWWVLGVGYLVHDGWRRYRTRWILGRGGIACWRPGTLVVLSWDDLCDDWEVVIRKPADAGRGSRLWMRLIHPSGSALYIDDGFAHGEVLIRRVVRVLAERDAAREGDR